MAISSWRGQDCRFLRAAKRLQARRRRLLLRQRGRGWRGPQGGFRSGSQARGCLCRDQGVGDLQHSRCGGAGQELEEPRAGVC